MTQFPEKKTVSEPFNPSPSPQPDLHSGYSFLTMSAVPFFPHPKLTFGPLCGLLFPFSSIKSLQIHSSLTFWPKSDARISFTQDMEFWNIHYLSALSQTDNNQNEEEWVQLD